MSIKLITNTDLSILEDLDYGVICESEAESCDREATWLVEYSHYPEPSTPHSFLMCDRHRDRWIGIMASYEHVGIQICAVCDMHSSPGSSPCDFFYLTFEKRLDSK